MKHASHAAASFTSQDCQDRRRVSETTWPFALSWARLAAMEASLRSFRAWEAGKGSGVEPAMPFPKPSKQVSVSTGPWVVDNSQRARMPHTLTPKAREKEGGMLRRASALQLTSSPAAYTHPAHQPRLTMSRSSCMWPFMRCALSTARGPSPLRPRQGTIRTMGINFRLPTWITGIGDRDADATAPT